MLNSRSWMAVCNVALFGAGLVFNRMLDDAEVLSRKANSGKTARLRFQRKVRAIWKAAKAYEGVGEFGKILKRLCRLAGLAG